MPAVAALISVLIMERPLCVDCIALRAQVGAGVIMTYLATIEAAVKVRRGVDDRCRACGAIGRTYSVTRPD
jgi:hypothetical protein